MLEITKKIQAPTPKAPTFAFRDIPVGGGMIVKASEGEDFKDIVSKVKNAVASFKKSHKEYKLSIQVHDDDVTVYRDSQEG